MDECGVLVVSWHSIMVLNSFSYFKFDSMWWLRWCWNSWVFILVS